MQLKSLLCSFAVQAALVSGLGLTWPGTRTKAPTKREAEAEMGGLAKRGAETNATLYAYGRNSSSWPVAYGLNDGLLYITQTPDDSAANLTEVFWDLAAITGENWIANATFLNGTVSGFALFATQLVYNNNSYLEAQFWAKPTATDGIFSLCWIVDNVAEEGSFPVVIKGVEN